MKLFKIVLLLLTTTFITSCFPEVEGPYEDSRFIKDEYGRTLILHGLNTASNAKCVEGHMPNLTEDDVEKEVLWGFNVVRLLTFWAAIEPDSGYYDQTYLDNYIERLNWYTDRGIHVIVDMHQDIYSCKFGGSGHPDWAIKTNGFPIPDPPIVPWWLNAVNPAVEAAHRNFWQYSTYSYLQDRYVLMYQELVNRVKDNPMVIGYDIMNEPHSGNIQKTLNSHFEKGQLKRFYNRVTEGIRAIDPNKYIFYEPQSFTVSSGAPSTLTKLEDPRSGERKMVYAPHCYPLFQEDGNGVYDDNAAFFLSSWEHNRAAELDRHNSPMLIGEFGLSWEYNGFFDYAKDFHNMADRMQSSWTLWSNDKNGGWSPTNPDGTETPVLNTLIRTYPQAIAGKLLDFSFDYESLSFELKFINNANISMPTEIYVPQRFYEGQWDLEVIGTNNWTEGWNAARQLLLFNSTDNNKEITIRIKPL